MQRSRTLTRLGSSFALLAVLCFGPGYRPPAYAQGPTGAADAQRQGFQVSFKPGSLDTGGHLLGGTEIRSLVAHAGKLFAGNGYWEDEPGSEGFQGAEILVLDRPGRAMARGSRL